MEVATVTAAAPVAVRRSGDTVDVPATVLDGFVIVGDPVVIENIENTVYVVAGARATPPTGTILEYPGTTAPTGFLMADGTAVSRTTYADLNALASAASYAAPWGSGDGSTTFNVPNRKGRVGVGRDPAQTEFDTLGETGGAKTHTLTTAEMPSHQHTFNVRWGDNAPTSGGTTIVKDVANTTGGSGSSSGTANTSNTGSGNAHNNLQPYITLNYIIKY
jgi:microcystin-dependent protein